MRPAQQVSDPLWIRSQSQVCFGKQDTGPSSIVSEWANCGKPTQDYSRGSLLQGTSSGSQCGFPLVSACLPKLTLQQIKKSSLTLIQSACLLKVLHPMEEPGSLFFNAQRRQIEGVENGRIEGGAYAQVIPHLLLASRPYSFTTTANRKREELLLD